MYKVENFILNGASIDRTTNKPADNYTLVEEDQIRFGQYDSKELKSIKGSTISINYELPE